MAEAEPGKRAGTPMAGLTLRDTGVITPHGPCNYGKPFPFSVRLRGKERTQPPGEARASAHALGLAQV